MGFSAERARAHAPPLRLLDGAHDGWRARARRRVRDAGRGWRDRHGRGTARSDPPVCWCACACVHVPSCVHVCARVRSSACMCSPAAYMQCMFSCHLGPFVSTPPSASAELQGLQTAPMGLTPWLHAKPAISDAGCTVQMQDARCRGLSDDERSGPSAVSHAIQLVACSVPRTRGLASITRWSSSRLDHLHANARHASLTASSSIRAGVSVRADYLNMRAQRAKRFLKELDPLHRL